MLGPPSSHFIAAAPASSKLLSGPNKSGERRPLNRRGRASPRQPLGCAPTRAAVGGWWGQARSTPGLEPGGGPTLPREPLGGRGRGGGRDLVGMLPPPPSASSVHSPSHLAPLSHLFLSPSPPRGVSRLPVCERLHGGGGGTPGGNARFACHAPATHSPPRRTLAPKHAPPRSPARSPPLLLRAAKVAGRIFSRTYTQPLFSPNRAGD